jgi:hypothetical protein
MINLAKEFEKPARAQKIVLDSELSQKHKALIKEEFSLSDKFCHRANHVVNIPIKLMYITAILFKAHMRKTIGDETYERVNPLPTQRRDRFSSGLFLAEMAAYFDRKFFINLAKGNRSQELYLRAFDECRDYTAELESGGLKNNPAPF